MVCASVQLIWQLHVISQVNLRRKGIKGTDLKPSAEETAALSFQFSAEDIPARLSHSGEAPRLADAHLFRLMTRIYNACINTLCWCTSPDAFRIAGFQPLDQPG